MNFWKEGETNRIDSYNDSSGFQDLYIRTKNAIFEIGNLGIGTSNPTKKLEINGETLTKGIYSEHTGQYWSGTFQSALADKSKRWLFGIRGGAGSSKFSFQHYNGSAWLGDLLTLLGSDGGRVGIGQNNPTEKLDVNGIIKTNGLTLSSIPSSPSGLSSGMVYRDGNNLKIIP
ncbi:hypothetical protein DLH72_02145 [Candidatus Gracilibacteria bacterium]|nr:MAG: hypothetical protein DLH72_02145 [Candidatus Gracilibacteria bacterium]